MEQRTKRLSAAAAIATALAVPAEGLLRRFFPAFAISDKVDERLGHASNNRQSVRGNPLIKQLTNVRDSLCREFVRRLVFTAQVNKPGLPSMLSISRQADPLKVLRPVIGLDPIDVIDAKTILVTVDKGPRDKSVNKEPGAFSVDAKPDLAVSGVMRLRCYLHGLSLASNGLRFSVTNPCVCVGPGRNADSASATYFKCNASLGDGFPNLHYFILSVLGVRMIGGTY